MQKTLLALCSVLLLSMTTSVLFAQPANDDCANATVVSLGMDQAFTTIDATTDGPEHPTAVCFSAGTDSVHSDVWYSFTAPMDMWVLWSVCDSADYDTRMVVYNAGTTCPAADGDLYVCNDDAGACANFTGEVIFEVTSGSTYLLRLGGYGETDPGESGSGTFNLIETAAPPMGSVNDNCEDAIVVMIGDGQEFDNTNNNTDGPEHPTASCFAFGNDFVNQDMWYSFTAPNTATIEWSTCNLTFWDTRMAVYNGGATCPLTDDDLLACNDDGAGCDNFTSYMTFPVTQGETYLLRLGGYATSDFGMGIFNLREIIPPDPPVNDVCATSAIPVNVVSRMDADAGMEINEGTTAYGTQDAGVPPCINNGELFDVWYTFNSGTDTTLEVRFNILTDTAAFILEIYEDCETPALDTANGGSLTLTCRTYAVGDGLVSDTINGFPGTPTDYTIRVSTVVTFESPGDFWFQLINEDIMINTDDDFTLENVRLYPNPVTETAQVALVLDEAARTTLEVVNSLGQVVSRQEEGLLISGEHQLDLNTANLHSGVYFLRVTADEKQRVLKFVRQ